MGPIELIILFTTAGIVLLIGELLLPTHGLLGVLGILCIGAAISVCFYIDRWLGLGVFFATLLVSPLVVTGAIRLWVASPIGRRVILHHVETTPVPISISLGQVGVAVTELRPIGECDFGDLRLEAVSELGIIPVGKKVKVVSLDNARPVVRAVEALVERNSA